MKRLFGFAVVIAALSLSGSVFAQNLVGANIAREGVNSFLPDLGVDRVSAKAANDIIFIAQEYIIELNGKKYEVAKQDLAGWYEHHEGVQAETACKEFVDPVNFHDDWSLPSFAQVRAMWDQLYKKDLGGFVHRQMYGCSNDDPDFVFIVFINEGEKLGLGGDPIGKVRCIREVN